MVFFAIRKCLLLSIGLLGESYILHNAFPQNSVQRYYFFLIYANLFSKFKKSLTDSTDGEVSTAWRVFSLQLRVRP